VQDANASAAVVISASRQRRLPQVIFAAPVPVPPSHGGNTGSNPVGDANQFNMLDNPSDHGVLEVCRVSEAEVLAWRTQSSNPRSASLAVAGSSQRLERSGGAAVHAKDLGHPMIGLSLDYPQFKRIAGPHGIDAGALENARM
jgi:hypothetical protein